ncbi:MAG: sulfotransferase family 2 domain-containing protein [Flavobacteriales bacterium]
MAGPAMGPVHLLHIRKTGGTALKHALQQAIADTLVMAHEHATGLGDVAVGRRVAFVVRDPMTRFISGFNSRLRQGAPRYHVPWNAEEAAAFARFGTPAYLADALAAGDPDARKAMQAIRHVNSALADQLGGVDLLERRRTDIVFVGRQETLAADLPWLARVLGLAELPALPADDVLAHRTPPGMATGLSAAGEAAIRAHYQQDAAILRWCDAFRLAARNVR